MEGTQRLVIKMEVHPFLVDSVTITETMDLKEELQKSYNESPKSCTDLNKVMLPKEALVYKPPTIGIVGTPPRRNLNPRRPCGHCQINDADFDCILDKLNGEYSIACEDALMQWNRSHGEDSSVMRQRRMSLYMFMGVRCLLPLGVGDRRRLPACVVQDIQETFPDLDNAQSTFESRAYLFRRHSNPDGLFLEILANPIHAFYPGE